MRRIIPNTLLAFLLIFLVMSSSVFAHQPRIVQSETTKIIDPEISKAYYATLSGAPHTYTIDSQVDFDLYVGILLPDIGPADKTTIAEVFQGEKLLVKLGGETAEWKKFFEPFDQSSYLDGGEYKARAQAGVYTIKVSSQKNASKYSLAVGEIEAFDRAEGTNALSLIPDLKKDFFEESPISFIKSPFGWGLIVAMYVLAFVAGMVVRFVMKKLKTAPMKNTKGIRQNIGKKDRLIRLAIGVGLLLWAITTTWSPILIFFSGFAIFEAIFSWCAYYQLIGKNSCEMA